MYRTLSPGAIDVSVNFEEGARLAARHGFEGLALASRHLLEKGDDAYEASLARLEAVAEAAQQVGCRRASTYIFSRSDDKDYRANFAFHIDPSSFLGALLSIGYDGPVVVEPFSHRLRAMPAEDTVRTTAEALHKVWRDAGLADA